MAQIEVDTPPRRTINVVVIGLIIASFIGMWGYVMYLSFVEGRVEPRDRLTDTTFPIAAEAVCAGPVAAIAALPMANEVQSPEQRADLLDHATVELVAMVAELRRIPLPSVDGETGAVSAWLDDWDQYNLDRSEYAAAQRDPSNPRYDKAISVTDRAGFHIDTNIDDFAHVNYMDSCETPDDV